jgi:hypothetical protein
MKSEKITQAKFNSVKEVKTTSMRRQRHAASPEHHSIEIEYVEDSQNKTPV